MTSDNVFSISLKTDINESQSMASPLPGAFGCLPWGVSTEKACLLRGIPWYTLCGLRPSCLVSTTRPVAHEDLLLLRLWCPVRAEG